MNKIGRALIHIPCGIVKMGLLKIMNGSRFCGNIICAISPLTEISLDKGGYLSIGKSFRMRDGAKLRVRKGARCEIGKNVSINSNNVIACRECIMIGENVQFSPNVMIYDHDHDFRDPDGIGSMKYKTSPVKIGNNVWLGANSVILRGTELGDGCVVAAGCVVKGVYPENSLIIQKREETVNVYHRK